MKATSTALFVAVLAALLLVWAGVSCAQPRTDDIVPLSVGKGVLGLGVDVGPYRLFEPSTSVGLDLRLRWPTALTPGESGVEPYLSVGPTLFVTDPDQLTRMADPRADTTLGLGVRAGAGMTWTLDPHALLYGEYHLTRGASERLLPLGRSATDVSGFDLLYGVRLRF